LKLFAPDIRMAGVGLFPVTTPPEALTAASTNLKDGLGRNRSGGQGCLPGLTYRPTADDHKTVHSMVTVGFEQSTICERLGITDKTLRKHFRRDLDIAYTTLVHDVRVFVNKAKTDTQALIYLNRVLGWNDRPAQPAGVNLNLNLSLANMDEDALRVELAEILTVP
jgi:AraC-like DNA-binding protein